MDYIYTSNRLGHKIFYVRGGYFSGDKLRFSCDIFGFWNVLDFFEHSFYPSLRSG